MIDSRQLAIETVECVLVEAKIICADWCSYRDFPYDFGDVIQVAKLILEEQERIRNDEDEDQ